MATGNSRILATAPKAEGIITMGMDPKRKRLYGLTWPRGFFIYYDMKSDLMRNLGPVSRDGEVGTGDKYFCLCRTFAMFPGTGDVYFTNPDGEILCYSRVTLTLLRNSLFVFRDFFQFSTTILFAFRTPFRAQCRSHA